MKTFKEQKWMLLVYALIFIAVGIVQFVLSILDVNKAVAAVSYALACGLFALGLMHIITCFITDTKAFFKVALVLGAFAIAIGVVLILNPLLIKVFLIPFVAVLALALGAVMLVKAIVAIVYKYKAGWIVLYFSLFAICVTVGVVFLVYLGVDIAVATIFATAGIALAALGIFIFVFALRLLIKKKDDKEEDEKVVETVKTEE